MDDLYGNAWGEPSKTDPIASSSSSKLWTTPKLPLSPHEEVDLAAPSWGTGTDVRWNETSEDTHGFSWSNADPDLAWGASTYPETDTRLDSGYQTTETTEATADEETREDTEEDVKAAESSPSGSPKSLSATPPLSPSPVDRQDTPVEEPPTSETRTSSPEGDAFGTFATPFDSSSKPLSSDITPELEPDAWGSPWSGGGGEGEESESAKVDEWEAARQQKEKLDRKIPPEVLAGILAQCAEYCREAWPDTKEDSSNSSDPEWMSTWRNGMDSIEGLETLMQSIVPDLTLEPPVQFTKTSIAKSMATAVRLTKNMPLSKNSPMFHYMAARGSTAWENSVKERKVVEEDVIPIGWRMVEKQPANTTAEPAKTTKTGGIFSFWGRRQSRIPSTQSLSDSPRPQSPSAATSSPTAEASSGSRSARASQDSVRSRSAAPAKDEKVASPLTETASPTPSQPPALYADAPDLHTDGSATPPLQTQAPSAVSRFLNRFSRRQSNMSVSSAHSSFALSGDDLEFLSDIVPSAQDTDAEEPDLKALSSVLKPEPLPPALPPPPAAPPVRPSSTVSSQPAPPSSMPLIPMGSEAPSKKPAVSRTDDLDGLDFFGSFESSPMSKESQPSTMPAEPASMLALSPVGILADGASGLKSQHTGGSLHQPKLGLSARPASPPSLFGSMMTKEPYKHQPFQLPPPPAPASRPHTPTLLVPTPPPATSSPTSSLSDTIDFQRPRSMSRGPKVPLSFTIPPPSAASLVPSAPPTASSIKSTQSDIPLGELYPGSVVPDQPAQFSASSFSAFTLPPPPSSRPFTPPVPSATMAPLLSPPPASSKLSAPSHQPAKSLNLFDDDDDFADFQSPAPSIPVPQPAPLAAPVTQPKPVQQASIKLTPPPSQPSPAPTAPFTLPPPPSQSRPSSQMSFTLPPPPSSRTTTVPILPPPSRSSTAVASGPSTPQHQSSDPFDDFDSFLSSSSTLQPSSSKPLGFASFNSDKSLLTPRKNRHAGFEGQDSPVSSAALRTPSPPRPISKSPRHLHQSISVSRQGEKKVKASQHLHTLSLMERAAARPGQWPAPPSPLPQALPFPGSSLGPTPKESMDLLADDSFGAFESDTLSPSSSSSPTANSPITAPSSKSFPSLSQTNTGGSGYSAIRPSGTSNLNSSSNSTAGGLSAQDLSFFEGL
ncbi:hypothetical protein EIP86_000981 [Pleurotus ostreatoroseus]|nr:hypothetical protein EIP86_000981 [Pleurotus ostreatoroseus]